MCERFMCGGHMCGHPMTERLVCDRPMRDHPMCERPDTLATRPKSPELSAEQPLWFDAALENKLVPCAWLLSGALEVWRLRLRFPRLSKKFFYCSRSLSLRFDYTFLWTFLWGIIEVACHKRCYTNRRVNITLRYRSHYMTSLRCRIQREVLVGGRGRLPEGWPGGWSTSVPAGTARSVEAGHTDVQRTIRCGGTERNNDGEAKRPTQGHAVGILRYGKVSESTVQYGKQGTILGMEALIWRMGLRFGGWGLRLGGGAYVWLSTFVCLSIINFLAGGGTMDASR